MSARDFWMEDWTRRTLDSRGISLLEPLQLVHERPWSRVHGAVTDGGCVFVKSTHRREVALTRELSIRYPRLLPPLLGTEILQGLLLQGDGGETLREIADRDRTPAHWDTLLTLYARMQIDLSSDADELVHLGCPDWRLARIPGVLETLLADPGVLEGREGLTTDELKRLIQLQPAVADLCEQLSACKIPETLQHDDFHDGNIFVKPYAFFDWGDACVTHPFCTMVVALRTVARRYQLTADDSYLAHCRDAYLSSWSELASPPTLLRALDLAQQLGLLIRALTWDLSIRESEATSSALEQYRGAVGGWLREFLQSLQSTS